MGSQACSSTAPSLLPCIFVQTSCCSGRGWRPDVSGHGARSYGRQLWVLPWGKASTHRRRCIMQPACTVEQLAARVQVSYRCRTCRTLVATSRNTITVPDPSKSEVEVQFAFRRRRGLKGAAPTADAGSLFVEPLRWMKGLHEVSGKLYCPGCAASVQDGLEAAQSLSLHARVCVHALLHLPTCVAFAPASLGPAAPLLCLLAVPVHCQWPACGVHALALYPLCTVSSVHCVLCALACFWSPLCMP
jgi:hypothetical protein